MWVPWNHKKSGNKKNKEYQKRTNKNEGGTVIMGRNKKKLGEREKKLKEDKNKQEDKNKEKKKKIKKKTEQNKQDCTCP